MRNLQLQKGKCLKQSFLKAFNSEADAKAFLDKNSDAAFSVSSLEKKPAKKSPAPPFTTSTLQQEAARKLYFSVSKTMNMAQRLYEAGLITYMRTDSVNLSQEARNTAAQEISSSYGDTIASLEILKENLKEHKKRMKPFVQPIFQPIR